MSMQQLETVVSVESDEIMRGKMRGATDQCRICRSTWNAMSIYRSCLLSPHEVVHDHHDQCHIATWPCHSVQHSG